VTRRALFIAANVAVLSLAAIHCYDAWQVNRFAGVGGVEEYRRQKYEQLDRLKTKLDHLPPEIREQELRWIEDQIRELETGGGVAEIGAETRRMK